MTPVERVELSELQQQMVHEFRSLREDMARGFRDMSRREDDTRDRVARMEGGVAMVRWLGPSGIVAIVAGLLIQAGFIR
jgi:hypothetical protein